MMTSAVLRSADAVDKSCADVDKSCADVDTSCADVDKPCADVDKSCADVDKSWVGNVLPSAPSPGTDVVESWLWCIAVPISIRESCVGVGKSQATARGQRLPSAVPHLQCERGPLR